MITNSEEANKYYQLVNQYIDNYTEKHKIKASNLGKYLKNNSKLVRFIERHGLKDITNVNRVIDDVIQDRISMERDLVKTFESFKIFESDEFKILNLRQCLYKGVDSATIEHEKILADYFDVSLSHINIINAGKHIFKIDSLEGNKECVIFTNEEIHIIKTNIKEYCFTQVFDKKIKLEGVSIEINVNVKDFIDKDKFESHIDEILTLKKVNEIVHLILSCDNMDYYNNNFIGLNPSNY